MTLTPTITCNGYSHEPDKNIAIFMLVSFLKSGPHEGFKSIFVYLTYFLWWNSGMDALTKRLVWSNIQRKMAEGKTSVILTSHSMEECEVIRGF